MTVSAPAIGRAEPAVFPSVLSVAVEARHGPVVDALLNHAGAAASLAPEHVYGKGAEQPLPAFEALPHSWTCHCGAPKSAFGPSKPLPDGTLEWSHLADSDGHTITAAAAAAAAGKPDCLLRLLRHCKQHQLHQLAGRLLLSLCGSGSVTEDAEHARFPELVAAARSPHTHTIHAANMD